MLTERQKLIFKYIVEDYTDEAQPIGSKSLAKQLPVNLSSATVRNEMAVLANQHLIEKVHTSSGRVPSNEGYRYYIDNLVRPVPVGKKQRNLIHQSLSGSYQQIDDVVKESADVLSTLTDYTALTLSPEQTETVTLDHFQLTKIASKRVMAIMVLSSGEVESQPFKLNHDYTVDQLQSITNLVNDKLDGLTIPTVLKVVDDELPELLRKYLTNSANIGDALEFVISKAIKDHFFVSGRMNLLDSVDDATDVKSLVSMFGNASSLDNFFDKDGKPVSVLIGSELQNHLLENYSVISGTYDVGNRGVGRIAVVGPKSMSYPKVLGVVDAFRSELKNTIDGLIQ